MDLRGTRPLVRLPQTGRQSGFNAWIGDERMSTFVLSTPGQPPRPGELQRLRMLDAREPRPAEGPVDMPKVPLADFHTFRPILVTVSHIDMILCLRLQVHS